jgi:hypothetical protein
MASESELCAIHDEFFLNQPYRGGMATLIGRAWLPRSESLAGELSAENHLSSTWNVFQCCGLAMESDCWSDIKKSSV